MTWLVTGGSGQLGREFREVLAKLGIKYVSPNSRELDIANLLIVDQLIDAIRPRVIINCAAYTNVDGAESHQTEAFSVNADGAGNLATAAKACGAIFGHISTDYVFSGHADTPYLENAVREPFNTYGQSKAAGEQFIMDSYEEGSYVFRTAWLYSSYGKNFAKTIAQKAFSSTEVTVVNDQIGQPTHAHDLVERVIETVLKELPKGFYHATNSGTASWFEFAQEIYGCAEADKNLVKPVGSDSYTQIAKRPAYSVLSHQRWLDVGLSPMRDWKVALKEAFPQIALGSSEEETNA